MIKKYQLRPFDPVGVSIPEDAQFLKIGKIDVTIYCGPKPNELDYTVVKVPESWKGKVQVFNQYIEL